MSDAKEKFKVAEGKARATKSLDDSNAGELVQLLNRCGGDLANYAASFSAVSGTEHEIVARSLFVLGKEGNEPHLRDWEDLIKAFKTARMLISENKAIDALKQMPIPTSEGDTKSSLDQWLKYASFWLGDIREELKTKAKKAAPIKSDPTLAKLYDLFKSRKARRQEEQEKNNPPLNFFPQTGKER